MKRELNFSEIDALMGGHLGKTFPAAQIAIRARGEVVYENAFGYLDPDTRARPTQHDTRFDFASVSKLFTVTAFMTFVEQGRVALDQPVCEILPPFTGARPIEPYPDPLHPGQFVQVVSTTPPRAEASRVTFRHLLAHNAGLPAWLPLWKIAAREQRRDAVLNTAFAYPTGTRVVYSDIGLILVGFALEKIACQPLDAIVRERVTAPLGLESIGYGPIAPDNVAPTEFYAHQHRRMCGEVHDENAWSLGGVAGHAGLFGTARDLAAFGEALRTSRLLKRETLTEMTRVQAQESATRRGIGFLLWSADPDASSHPLSEETFGHTGFTGTSLWVDPARELVVACLTNRVYYGREHADAMMAFRVAFHRAVRDALDGKPSAPIARPTSALVLGIDGGGTRTRARLANWHGDTLGEGEAGASNPQGIGFAAAQANLLTAIQNAFDAAHLERTRVAAACLGLAGADRPDERHLLTEWAREQIAPRVEIINDGLTVLAAGTPENWGVALIAGTGSSAWGRAPDGRTTRAGGWGYLIGDEGSAYWLACQALHAATQAADGRGDATRLLRASLDFWNLREPSELVARVYRTGLTPADFARLAPVVMDAAHAGDPVAQKIVADAADALATLIVAVARKLQFDAATEIPLALTGGLLLETASLRARVLESARARGYRFAPALVHAPVAGAVRLARRLLAER